MSREKQTEFNPYDVKPLESYLDNYEKIKNQAEQYIYKILLGAQFFEFHGQTTKPTVFMSMDIMAVIAKGANTEIYHHKYNEPYSILGYPLKITTGTNELYIGFNLLEDGL